MRAVETGRWLARADVAGGTSLISPSGQEIETARGTRVQFLDVIAGREQGNTVYVRWGWKFGPVTMAISLGLIVLALIVGRKSLNPSETLSAGDSAAASS